MVKKEGLDKSREKRLGEKLKVSAKMAREDPSIQGVGLEAWIQKTVKSPREYLELLSTADDQKAYTSWLLDIAP